MDTPNFQTMANPFIISMLLQKMPHDQRPAPTCYDPSWLKHTSFHQLSPFCSLSSLKITALKLAGGFPTLVALKVQSSWHEILALPKMFQEMLGAFCQLLRDTKVSKLGQRSLNIYLSIHLSNYLSKYLSNIYSSIYPSNYMYICIHLSIYLSVYPSLSICHYPLLSIYLSIYPSIYPSIHPICASTREKN